MELYTKYYNVPLLVCTIMACLRHRNTIDIARLSLFLPALLDNSIEDRLSIKYEKVTLSNLLSLNQRSLSNYNSRYYTLLPYFVSSLSLLMDTGVIILHEGQIINKSNGLFDDMENWRESEKLQKIIITSDILMNITEAKSTRALYNLFNVEL